MVMYSSLFLIGSIFLPAYASGTELIETENPVDGKYIVTTAPGVISKGDDEIGASQANKIRQIIAGPDGDDIGAQSHGEVGQVYGIIEGFAATLDEVGLQNVLNSPDVVSVEQDGYVQINQVGSWGLDRIDDEDLPLDQSYDPTFGKNGEGVTAYIIDTGILASHDEFENRATQEFNSAGGENVDCNGHGTHVAGTVGSKTYGVANKVKLVGVKVLNCGGSGTWSGVIAGIDWVAANAKKPATANMSLGGGKSDAVNAAVKRLVDSGVSTVLAAGNNNGDACQLSPASEVSAITVGSTTNVDARSSFSNWGTCVDVFAPGSNIKAPWIGSTTATRTISGTSMASPHVCGGVALYLGKDPTLSTTEVADMLLADSIAGTISNIGTGSPNQFLYVGSSQAPTESPAPTKTVTTAPTKAFGPVAQVDFSDPDASTNSPFSLKNGAKILPAPDGVSGALRIDKDGPYALIPGVNISPSNMNECTLTAGLYLESIANRFGWVFGHEDSGYDRTILMHDYRFGGGIASAVGFPWKPWKNSNQPPIKKWVHVTAVFRQGGQSYVFLDGVRSDFITTAKNSSGKGELWVGRPHHGGHWVNSWIKEVKVFDTALSDDVVKEQSKEFYKSLEKGCRDDSRIPLEIFVSAGNHGDENSVAMKVMADNGWRKRKAIYRNGFENNKMTGIKHCIRSDKCYKIAIKDKEGDGMSDGDGSYEIVIDGETVKSSKFSTGSKETFEINCS